MVETQNNKSKKYKGLLRPAVLASSISLGVFGACSMANTPTAPTTSTPIQDPGQIQKNTCNPHTNFECQVINITPNAVTVVLSQKTDQTWATASFACIPQAVGGDSYSATWSPMVSNLASGQETQQTLKIINSPSGWIEIWAKYNTALGETMKMAPIASIKTN